MAHDPRLLDFLESLARSTWEGAVYRYTAGRRPPDKENTDGARWNPKGVPAVYAALCRETLVAEFTHHLSLWSPRPTRLAFTQYGLKVAVQNVVDLRPHLEAVGIAREALAGDDHSRCQVVGGAAWWLGRGGLLVPSARRAGGTNLVIFTDRQAADWFEVTAEDPLGIP